MTVGERKETDGRSKGSDPQALPPSASSATFAGLAAILLWSTLASLTAAVPEIPPFQLATMTFALATLVGLAHVVLTGASLAKVVRVPLAAWALGVYGLLGYHVCYFAAFRHAPAVEVNLVNYLWPLLIVVLSGLLPARHGGKGLRWWHAAGALMGFASTVLVMAGSGVQLDLTRHGLGYVAALAAAFIWSTYSVASRLLAAVPTAAVTGACAATSLGALVGHLALETTVWPRTAGAWVSVLAAGIGPVGIAFYLWDHAMKRGNIRLIGVASYAAPLLSTLLLTLLGLGRLTPVLGVSALLVTLGALLAGREAWDRRVTGAD